MAKNLILVITGLLAGAALYISVLILQTQHVLGGLTRYNATWLMSQAATDVARLEAATGKYGLTGDEADADEVQLRYEILLNRIGLLANGEVRDLIGKSPQMQQLAAQMKAAVAEASGPVERIARPGSAAALVGAIDPLNAAVAQLATAAYTESGEAAGRDLRHLDELHWIFSGVLAGLIACCLSLVGILRWHNRMLRTAHNEVQDLVSGLQQASMELVTANQQIQDAMQEAQTQNRILRERDIELHHQNARFTAALDNMSQGLCMVDAEGDLIVCNARFLELFRLRADEAVSGRAIRDLFRVARRNGVFDTSVIRAIETEQQQLAEDRNGGSFFKEDGDGNAIAVSHRPMLDGGWVATYEDITERRRVDAKISFIARHDPLTQLANRFHFQEQMERALQFRRRRGDKVAVLLLDLDNFKDVNDTLGHPVGDMLLKSVSDRLRACLRETDVIGRLGGDEFAILHVDANQPEGAAALARNMVEVLCEPFELDGRQVFVGVSVGIAIAQDDDDDASRLLKNADVALYRAKAEGRGTWRVFEAAMEVEVELRLSTGADLREALSRNELEIYYQPLFGLDENRVTGYEALLRWHHPQRGLISPVQFIPIAEELGLIIPIGEWLLEQACKDATTWPDDVKIAVNLSPIQIRSGDIVASVKRALAASGLAAARLELEITESALLQDSQKVVDTLHALRRLGLRTALDDFGTGYSSLSYLRSFPFDKIKIDQVFVREIGQRSDCLAIVNSIARLAGDLGMTTTAEGVETEAQLHFLRHAGCEEVQGFLFGRPRPLGMIERTMPVLPALTAA